MVQRILANLAMFFLILLANITLFYSMRLAKERKLIYAVYCSQTIVTQV